MGGMCGICVAYMHLSVTALTREHPIQLQLQRSYCLSVDCTMPTTLVAFITVRKHRFTILHTDENN